MKYSRSRWWTGLCVVIAATLSCDRSPVESRPQPTPTEPPVAISLDQESISFSALGDTFRVRVSGRDQHGNTTAVSGAAWWVSDTLIATVNDGLVQARNNGIVSVNVAVGNLTDSALINVRQEVAVLAVLSGNGQYGAVGATLPHPVIVSARDSRNNPVPGAEMVWRGDGGATVSSNVTMSDYSGQGEVLLRLGATVGSQSAVVTAGGAEARISATAIQQESNRVRRVVFDRQLVNVPATTLVSGMHAAQIESDSTGLVEINPEIPQIVSLLNNSGIIVSAVVLPNAPGTIRLDSHSTAVAFGFLTPGIASTDHAVATRRISQIEAAVALPPLTGWLEQRRQTHPGSAIPTGDPTFLSMINALVDEVLADIISESSGATFSGSLALFPLPHESTTTSEAITSYRVLSSPSYADASIRILRDVAGGTEVAVTNQGGRVVVVVEAYYQGTTLTVPTARNGTWANPRHVLLPYSTLHLIVPHGHRLMQIGIVGPALEHRDLFDRFPARAYSYYPLAASVVYEVVLEAISSAVGGVLRKDAASAKEFMGLLMGRSAVIAQIGNNDLSDLAWTVIEEAVELARENPQLMLRWAAESGRSGITEAAIRQLPVINWSVSITAKLVHIINTYGSVIPVISFTLKCDTCESAGGRGSIQGVVTCRSAAVSGATVTSGSVSARTDVHGNYTLAGVASGVQSVSIAPNPHAGCFYPSGRTVDVPTGGSVTLNFGGAPQPRISSVSPNPAPAQQARQSLTISGGDFMSGAQVILRLGAQAFTIPAERTQVAANRIVVTAGLGTQTSAWTAEVLNPGGISSGRFTFQVGASSPCSASQGAGFVSESHPDNTQVGAGQTFTKTWTLRNVSNCVWDSGTKLQYVSNTAGLLSTSQAAVAVSGTVQPNGTFVFSVPMRAPSSPGTYREDWKLVDANGSTIRVGNSTTIWNQIVVPQSGASLCTASSGAGFVGESHPDNTQVGAGQAFTKTWTLRNLGSNCVWDSRIRLQYVSNTAGLLSTSQAAVAVSGTVQPNGTFIFSVPMRAPSSPGTYREDWKLVDANGSTIRVGNSNTIWNQIVVPQSGPSLCTASSGAGFVGESHPDNTQVGAGQAFTKTWTLRNLGSNCVWDSRIRLQYVSNTAGLLSTSQAAVAVSGTVQPNGTFVFSVPMRAPSSPGTYREDWKLVDANGSTIRVGNSNTIWNQIVVPQSGPSLCTASSGAGFVGESHPDNTQVGAGQTFTKTWTLRNLGSNCVWDSRIRLQYVSNTAGLLSTSQAPVAVSGTVQPNGTFVFSVPMRAPSSPGTYREDWKLVDANGSTIRVGNSNTIWNQIVVTAAAPTVTSYSWNPSSPRANQGFGGTVSGSGFVAAGTEVWFCVTNTNTCYRHPAAGVTVGSASSLSVVNVQLGAGSWQVYVRTSAGASGRSAAFTVTAAAPTVTGYSWSPSPPRTNQSFGGTVSGSGFVAGGTEVWFCLTNTTTCYLHPAAGVTVGSASSLSVVNVQLGAGSWQVYVRTSAGASGRSAAFTVQS